MTAHLQTEEITNTSNAPHVMKFGYLIEYLFNFHLRFARNMALVFPGLRGELHIDSHTISLIFSFYEGTFMWYVDINPEAGRFSELAVCNMQQKVDSGLRTITERRTEVKIRSYCGCKLIDKTSSMIIEDDPIFICHPTVFSVFTAQLKKMDKFY